MRTCSIVLAKLFLHGSPKQSPVAHVHQRIISLWLSSGHTAAHADDWDRPLEMYMRLYPEESKMLNEIIHEE
jgi:hypothetical protein